jgi:hypothetical protein
MPVFGSYRCLVEKSTYATRLLSPSWLCRHPDKNLVACSHTDHFAEVFSRQSDEILDRIPALAPRLTPGATRSPGVNARVAQIGAALGRQFSYALINAIAPIPQQQVDDALAQLVGPELIFRRGAPPDAEYNSKHQLRTRSQRSARWQGAANGLPRIQTFARVNTTLRRAGTPASGQCLSRPLSP